MDQFIGTLTTYEMRVGKENFETKEATFKVSKKAKQHKDHQDFSRCECDQELAHFFRKLKHVLGKYKVKLPFKFFNYGRVGHYWSKFPYNEHD